MTPKDNTAVVCLSPFHGGMEMDALRTAILLANSMEVTLLAKQGSPVDRFFRQQAEENGIRFETVRFRSFFSPAIIFGVRRLLKQHKIRNVVFFGASEIRSLFFSFLGLDVNFLVRHGTTKSTPKKDPLHRLVYQNVSWHIAICQHIAENVRLIVPFGKRTRLKVIYSSLRQVPSSLPEPGLRQSSPVRILHVGRITEGKGQIEAIKACESLFQNDIAFELNCVGELDPNYKQQFESFVATKPFKNSVNFPGFSSDVAKYFRDSDIFLFPSKGEGLSNSFIEALGYGLICIAFDNTSFPELQNLGFDFFLARDQDITDLQEILLKAVTELQARKLPISKNVDLARQLFNPERELDEYLELLQ